MRYDFDKAINRYGSASAKWDGVEMRFGEPGLLPMWVADMDFMSCPAIIEAIKQRAEHGIFGYPMETDAYRQAVIGWMERRFHWEVRPEWLHYSPGVIPALSFIVQTFTQPGDKVLIQPPIYHPFEEVIDNNRRQVVYNPLSLVDGGYRMDFADLRRKAAGGVKMLLLCSPHNPVGRVWTKDELLELGEICLANGVLVVSDEVHADLLFPGHTHTPFASISGEFAQHCVVCTAASKTFNLAGLQTANIIIPNAKLSRMYKATMMEVHHLMGANIFGPVATEAAYRHGEPWLEELLDYLNQNYLFFNKYMNTRISRLQVHQLEGTYLAWVDCSGLGMDTNTLARFMRRQAKVAINDGSLFGLGGEGHIRINIACPRSVLKEGLRRIESAINRHLGDC